MAELKLTPKQENFCQLFIELGNASEAYRQAYDADSMNENTVNREAKRLLDNPKIATRLELIRKEHQTRHNLTVDDLLQELEEARKAAFEGERVQVSAAVAATMGKAKLLGLDKVSELQVKKQELEIAKLQKELNPEEDEDVTPVQVTIHVVDASKKDAEHQPNTECSSG
ncbi:terminase small subunit [Acinetobacter pittii]|uniref:terminase small subunit n=1 Tax=Acinetobacter pittii TaxID=48296 RepID=UPI000A366693|nr:terminase small subunit [Acinetobacter pittii]OTU22115.1 terminase small subunit [Acinetobacter pittii]